MAREVLGTMICPECGFEDAEVKRQSNPALAYRWCPECNAQYFARNPETTARLLEKIGHSPVTDTEPPAAEKKPEPAPPPVAVAPATAPAAQPKKKPGMAEAMAFLTGGKAA